MSLEKYFANKQFLDEAIKKYEHKKLVRTIMFKEALMNAHIDKAIHNLKYVNYLRKENQFIDWQIVGLYYAIYHAASALIAKKGYASKNHDATLLLVIKYYTQITAEEIKLINNLYINKEDAEFYTGLKEERKKASYSTGIIFSKIQVEELRTKTIQLVNKIRQISDTL